ncbi:MAG: glycosyltransferase family 2 protein [Candidatus Nanopelagicales bacterium]
MLISAIVPTRNSIRTIRSCLESLRNQPGVRVEIIVVDNHSTDGTFEVGQELADLALQQGPERSAQRNAGARAASGEVILFVDSDMVLEPGVMPAIVRRFAEDLQVGALTIPERSFGEGYLVRGRVLEKSLYQGSDTVESPRAFRRDAFFGTGGWDESLTAAEDWDLADRTRATGVRIARITDWIWHDEGRIALRGQFGKKRYYGRWVAVYLARKGGAAEHVTRPDVLRQPGRLLADPLALPGLVLLKGIESAGMLAGIIDGRRSGAVDAPAQLPFAVADS